jgi:hypothetical protein
LAALLPAAAAAQSAAYDASSRDDPKWEAGAAVGGGWVNDHPGSDQRHPRGLFTPLLIYRGPVLRIDREGVRGRVFDSGDVGLDLAASAAFDARDNRAREGMPKLDYLFGLGPQLVYRGLGAPWGRATVHLKARAVVSTDFRKLHGRGVALDPELRWASGPARRLAHPLDLRHPAELGQPRADEALLRGRTGAGDGAASAYRARAGYLGTELNLLMTRRESVTLTGFVTARGMVLHGAANSGSPLLRDRSTLSVGGGVLWTPWQSEARAVD